MPFIGTLFLPGEHAEYITYCSFAFFFFFSPRAYYRYCTLGAGIEFKEPFSGKQNRFSLLKSDWKKVVRIGKVEKKL